MKLIEISASALQNTVDKLVQRANASLLIGTSSWKEQFVEALTVNAGKEKLNYIGRKVLITICENACRRR